MIFVSLGTQDKSFARLVEKIEELKKSGKIKEEVVVQLGNTKYKSEFIKCIDFMSMEDFDKYLKNCRYLITHGGVGTILTALKYNKKVIAVPRLSKYNEHVNDHQLELIEAFSLDNYILGCKTLDDLEENINKISNFIPRKYKSNQDNFIELIKRLIENE
jgi:hypothetical protein